ncbi:hypothetical protein LBMAG03_14110 [Actinomycetes bacterium]|nr:hypothetical protein LBMAG03_14110 [Actinomycetes bacterium]
MANRVEHAAAESTDSACDDTACDDTACDDTACDAIGALVARCWLISDLG